MTLLNPLEDLHSECFHTPRDILIQGDLKYLRVWSRCVPEVVKYLISSPKGWNRDEDHLKRGGP